MAKVKVGIICSPGGHWFVTQQLKGWWSKHERFWVTGEPTVAELRRGGEGVHLGFFPENRSIGNCFRNMWLAWKLLRKERPDMIFSTGAGIAPPFFVVAKLLGIKTVFMEVFILVPKQTLSGRLAYHLSDLFLVQHEGLLEKYPRAEYYGAVL